MTEFPSVEICIDDRFEDDGALDRLVPAADLLSDADVSTRATRPYEIPLDEELFGDLVRTSAQHTVPLTLDELPDEAWPTEVYIVET
jgi:hypothetical protein